MALEHDVDWGFLDSNAPDSNYVERYGKPVGTSRVPRFLTGRVTIEPRAREILNAAGVRAESLLYRLVHGDFGDVCDETWENNQRGMRRGGVLGGIYRLGWEQMTVFIVV